MHRIDGPGATAGEQFTEGDPQQGIAPTVVTDDWLNDVQENLARAIEASGIALAKGDPTQLARAIALASGSRRNVLVNGDFLIWQRGSQFLSLSGTALYTADRWIRQPPAGNSNSFEIIRAAFSPGQVEVAGDPIYYLRWNQPSGLNGSGEGRISQRAENVWTLNGRVVTLSWSARAASGTASMTPRLQQNFGSGGSTTVQYDGAAASLTSAWARFSQTFTLASTAGATIGASSFLAAILEAPASFNGEVHVADVQLEAGSGATTFERIDPTTQRQLCERYYEKSYPLDTAASAGSGFGGAAVVWAVDGPGGILYSIRQRFRVPKRVAPAVTWYSVAAPNVVDEVTRIDPTTGVQTAVSVSFGGTTSETQTGHITVSSFLEGYLAANWTADAEL